MSFEVSNLESKLLRGLLDLKGCWVGMMEGRVRTTYTVETQRRDYRPLVRVNSRKTFPLSYFSVESLLVLLCLTASLLLLPLLLPPLPPPPFMLLLVPIGVSIPHTQGKQLRRVTHWSWAWIELKTPLLEQESKDVNKQFVQSYTFKSQVWTE